MKKKILMIANFEKTFFFYNLCKFLDNFEVYWMVVNLNQYNFIKKKTPIKNIIYINKKIVTTNKKNQLNIDLKLNELLYLDRSLKTDSNNDRTYLLSAATLIYNFVKKNKINYVLGEFTWAHELLTFRICKSFPELGINYLNPADLRVFPNRFLFFLDPEQSIYFKKKNFSMASNSILDIESYHNYISTINSKVKISNLKSFLFKLYKLLFKDYFDKNDPTYSSKFKRIINFTKRFINYFAFRIISKYKFKNLVKGKYIIYFLQKKPEASLDVKGLYYSDQLKNIEIIWKILPHDFDLIIKEHPSSIGVNNFSFYKNILSRTRTFLISNNLEFRRFVKNAYCTFSVSSTASMESALLNVPSFTFANCFFNEIKYSKKITLEDFRNSQNIKEIVDSLIKENKHKSDIIDSKFLKNSFNGTLYGSTLNSDKNLISISKALNEIVN
jgi:hypothetical protein